MVLGKNRTYKHWAEVKNMPDYDPCRSLLCVPNLVQNEAARSLYDLAEIL